MEYVAGTWYPIEAHQKTGEWVLLTGGEVDAAWEGPAPRVVSGQWVNGKYGEDGNWQFAWYDGGIYGEYSEPTHWQPLPNPPSEEPAP